MLKEKFSRVSRTEPSQPKLFNRTQNPEYIAGRDVRDYVSKFLNRTQAATYLNVKKSSLEAWAVRGGGPPMVKMGRAVRYRLTDLDAWAESRIRQNTSEA